MTAVIITIVVMYTDTIFEGNGYSANKTPTTGALLKTCEPPSAQKYTPPSENIQTRMHAIGRADLLHFLCHLSRSLPAARPGQCAREHKFISLNVAGVGFCALTESLRKRVTSCRRGTMKPISVFIPRQFL